MPEAVLPIVIAEERFKTVVQATIVLPDEPLLVEMAATQVRIDRCRVGNNSVVITGTVVINIPFKTGTRTETAATEVVCGDVRHCTAFIPFTILADLPGTMEGDECRVLQACVLDLFIERTAVDRLEATVEVCVRIRVTREQTVDVQGTIRPTTRFVTFPSFPTMP